MDSDDLYRLLTGGPRDVPCWRLDSPFEGERAAAGLLAARRARLSKVEARTGLGHYEGRGWRGFHHATLTIAAYGFLISEPGAIPPSAGLQGAIVKTSRLPRGYQPGGSPNQA